MFDALISNIQHLADELGINTNTALLQSGAGKNFISNIRQGSVPSAEKVVQLADYFGVSTDYLLGRTDSKEPPEAGGGPLRAELLDNFGQLNQEGQERLVETSDDMVSSGKYKNPDAVPADQPASGPQLVAARDGSRTEIDVNGEICFSEENAGLPE